MHKKEATMIGLHILTALPIAAMLLGCSSGTWELKKTSGVDLDVLPDSQAVVPLDVSVGDAADQWWFYDNFSFVGRVAPIGNILLVAEIGRCLDPGGDPRVIKTFRCRFFDGTEWTTIGNYREPDVINEMKTISVNPEMDFLWIEPNRSGTLRYLNRYRGPVIVDFMDLEPFYGLSSEGSFKRTWSAGLGRLEIGDTVWEGQMFREMVNIRGNNECTGNMPDFAPQNLYRVFAQSSAGKTIIASIDMGNSNDRVGNAFFAILTGGTYQVADGFGRIRNHNADFRQVSGFGQPLPHLIEIYSGDSINVRLDLWVDKDRWDILGSDHARTGVFGNAIFWNRREKAWGVVDHYRNPALDTLALMGDAK